MCSCLAASVIAAVSHHDREDDGSHGRFEDPEEGQAQTLDEGEEVDASLGYVPQIDQVRLVLGWHQEQLQAVHELTEANTQRGQENGFVLQTEVYRGNRLFNF